MQVGWFGEGGRTLGMDMVVTEAHRQTPKNKVTLG